MIEKLKYFPVNWVDGMKINKRHFISMQNYMEEVHKDAVGVNVSPINYGLLPILDRNSIDISVKIDAHNLVRVLINECYAITPNGYRIEITPETPLISENSYNSTVENNQTETVLPVKISVDPTTKELYGELDTQENPPRVPFLKPKYIISVGDNGQTTDGGYQVTIGKIIMSNNNCKLESNFIPPCTTVSSHPNLMAAFNEIDNQLGQLELYSVQISQKINRKSQTNQLAQMISSLTDKLLTFLGNNINEYRWSAAHSLPSYMLNKPIALARVVKNLVDSKSGSGKEELLNYFAQWCDLSQAQFESLFLNVINVGYNHLDINKTVKEVQHFLDVMVRLLSQINNLDYIGQRGDTGIFVKEQPNKSEITKSKRNRSFLDD